MTLNEGDIRFGTIEMKTERACSNKRLGWDENESLVGELELKYRQANFTIYATP